MITHSSFIYTSDEQLSQQISTPQLIGQYQTAQATLIQIYSHSANTKRFERIAQLLTQRFPNATIVGATTIGEIHQGQLQISQTTVDITFFEATALTVFSSCCKTDIGLEVGRKLGEQIESECTDIAGVMVLATPINFDTTGLIDSLGKYTGHYPVFGGGAGSYIDMETSLVYANNRCYERGVVVVVFSSTELEILAESYLGWRPLSKPMTITESDGLVIKSIDNKPAFDIYEKYLEIKNDENFFMNALEFPLLLKRDGEWLARVPVIASDKRELEFISDVNNAEVVSLGYGDLEEILSDARELHRRVEDFAPSVIYLFSCGCRRFLLQDEVDIETAPFQSIAPTSGFYTYGEYLGHDEVSFLNSTLVCVALREGKKPSAPPIPSDEQRQTTLEINDPYANQHTRVVSRLLTFIKNLSEELVDTQQELRYQARTDHLTRLHNRISLDESLNERLKHANRYQSHFSVILIDIDHFKLVNDQFGHLVGDQLLIDFATRLNKVCRSVDILGRWGGEEFLIVAPNTNISQSIDFAHNIKKAISESEFDAVGFKTVSIGVASWQLGESIQSLLERADEALYRAKNNGRNQVQA
ncbi:diguanylate cyclase [Vibrio maerlii]|uniref:sensor domain-containing diguanylate cyclase n=1 Tax=Vibrio maerlii TaxID=2231648 RepID=UPI000E3D4681|nr:diguanylate cyclase [Vibrio maerlii]